METHAIFRVNFATRRCWRFGLEFDTIYLNWTSQFNWLNQRQLNRALCPVLICLWRSAQLRLFAGEQVPDKQFQISFFRLRDLLRSLLAHVLPFRLLSSRLLFLICSGQCTSFRSSSFVCLISWLISHPNRFECAHQQVKPHRSELLLNHLPDQTLAYLI